MEEKETPAPYCHGEPMVPVYRYRGKDGKLYRTWVCTYRGCQHKEQRLLYEEEE